jgi:hypothetical protein
MTERVSNNNGAFITIFFSPGFESSDMDICVFTPAITILALQFGGYVMGFSSLQKGRQFRIFSSEKQLRLEHASKSSSCCSEGLLKKITSVTAERGSTEVRPCVVIGERIQSGLDPSPIWVSFVVHY